MNTRRLRLIGGLLGIFVGIVGAISVGLQKRATAKRERMIATLSEDFRKRQQEPVGAVVWEGKSFRPGDRVRIYKWAGTIKPDETGAATEVQANAGRTGIVVGGEKRQSTGYVKFDPAEPLQIVRVRWQPQTWDVAGGQPVALKEFESTIHVSHLEVVPQ